MKPAWPLPDLTIPELFVHEDLLDEYNRTIGERGGEDSADVKRPPQGTGRKDSPNGWNNPWPTLPNPDISRKGITRDDFKLDDYPCTCNDRGVLGYYMPWHIVALSFRNARGRLAESASELFNYNLSIPDCNRYGIHNYFKKILNVS